MTDHKKSIFVSFEPRNGTFIGLLLMDQILESDDDLEPILRKATEIYSRSIVEMRSLVAEIESIRKKRVLLPARKIWQLGDLIFNLTNELSQLSLEIDGLYHHLVRDLGVKRKWLEKVVIFRRYIPALDAIPTTLNWGRCEKGTRRVAEVLSNQWQGIHGHGDKRTC